MKNGRFSLLIAQQVIRRSFADSSYTFPYLSNNCFLKVRNNEDGETPLFSIVGVPYDGACTNRPGARFGPRSIREASHMLCDGIHPHFNKSPLGFLADLGDISSLPNTNLITLRQHLESYAKVLLKHKRHIVWLGGDHSITLSLLRAYHAEFGQPLSVLHFDAHCDTWSSHFSEPSGHGTWVYEAVNEGIVNPLGFTQIGIRSSGEKDTREYITNQGGLIFTARALRGLESPSELQSVVDLIVYQQEKLGHPPLYVTLDIDCLDPAYAPGTGTPEVGGLTSNQLLTILEELIPRLNCVGMDCVEVSPPYDHAELTSQIAATSVWTYICARLTKTMLTESYKS